MTQSHLRRSEEGWRRRCVRCGGVGEEEGVRRGCGREEGEVYPGQGGQRDYRDPCKGEEEGAGPHDLRLPWMCGCQEPVELLLSQCRL